jgi:predicted O-methyltransferase YrrM
MKTAIHALGCLIGLGKPHTQTTEAERNCLVAYAAAKHRLVELGVYEGVTTTVLGSAMSPAGVLYAVDPFFPGRLGFCWSELIARKQALHNTHRNIVFMKLLSQDAARSIDGDFDMIFVDADHSLEGITQDWNDWSSRVVQGIIALHDRRVSDHNPRVATFGSYKFFEEHIRRDNRFALVEQVDSLSILKRTATSTYVIP